MQWRCPNSIIDTSFVHKRILSGGQYDSFSVLIVAPNKYLSHNKEAQKYIHRVSYEQMLEHYLSRSDTRSKYKSALIERAILEQKSGYQYEANPCVVEFCAAMTAYQREKYPGSSDRLSRMVAGIPHSFKRYCDDFQGG